MQLPIQTRSREQKHRAVAVYSLKVDILRCVSSVHGICYLAVPQKVRYNTVLKIHREPLHQFHIPRCSAYTAAFLAIISDNRRSHHLRALCVSICPVFELAATAPSLQFVIETQLQCAMSDQGAYSALASFDVSVETGFIPSKLPLSRLPSYFEEWEKVVDRLAPLLQEKRLRTVVHELPQLEFSENTLHSIEEWRRALVMLSGLFQGYLWQEREFGLPEKMPAILAVPFNAVSRYIGLPPVITYASCVLYNWGLRDPSKPISGDNLYALVNHTGTESESWFFMVHVLVELEAVPALKGIAEAIAARADGNNWKIIRSLAVIETTLVSMQRALGRFAERCSPETFFVDIRPYLAFPKKLVYEGVESEPKSFKGASGAQTSILQSIDALLGAEYSGTDAKFLEEVRSYMPSKHKQFLEYISQQPSLRNYVMESGHLELVQHFNATVDALVEYRSQHIILVTSYIVNQLPHSVNPSLDEKGTGGTVFMKFLKNVRDSTKTLKIDI